MRSVEHQGIIDMIMYMILVQQAVGRRARNGQGEWQERGRDEGKKGAGSKARRGGPDSLENETIILSVLYYDSRCPEVSRMKASLQSYDM